MIQLHIATLEDVPLIRRLADEIWLDHYPQIIGMEQVTYMLGKMYSTERLTAQISDKSTFFLVKDDTECIGFIAVTPGEEPHHWFIDKFYLNTQTQGKGVGSEAFARLMDALPDAKGFSLQVNRQNYKSINFYFKNGFTIAKCLDVEIGDGYVMNDFLMKKMRP
jgi:diamine N-acetyltransferase